VFTNTDQYFLKPWLLFGPEVSLLQEAALYSEFNIPAG
jgi:hypothetical protein